jgi:hypothetical protein
VLGEQPILGTIDSIADHRMQITTVLLHHTYRAFAHLRGKSIGFVHGSIFSDK